MAATRMTHKQAAAKAQPSVVWPYRDDGRWKALATPEGIDCLRAQIRWASQMFVEAMSKPQKQTRN